jgi:hypothetical protein
MSAAERQRRHRKKVAGRSRAEGGDELHETPDIAVAKLLAEEPLPHVIWEPCCGPGAIVRILRGAGHRVIASDLRDYGNGQDFVHDFLTTTAAADGVEMIVMNPPFSKAAQFIRHALTLVPKLAVLLRLGFLESTAKRVDVMEGGHLARALIFRKRLPKMHRYGWNGKKASNGEGHAWLVWDKSHKGPPTVHWL